MKSWNFTGMPVHFDEMFPLVIHRLSPPTLPHFLQCPWKHQGRASNEVCGPQKSNLFFSGDAHSLIFRRTLEDSLLTSSDAPGGRFQYWHMISSLEKVKLS